MTADADGVRLAWPLERVLFALAGSMTPATALLVATVSTWPRSAVDPKERVR